MAASLVPKVTTKYRDYRQGKRKGYFSALLVPSISLSGLILLAYCATDCLHPPSEGDNKYSSCLFPLLFLYRMFKKWQATMFLILALLLLLHRKKQQLDILLL